MGKIIKLFFLFIILFAIVVAHAQTVKIDTTAMMGGAGYHVTCNNKEADKNLVSVSPKGLGKTTKGASFIIRGSLRKILVDDLNDDGSPELILCVYGGANGEMGTIAGVSCPDNANLVPVRFSDIYNDPKLREGYKGHDEFTAMQGTLLESFPIYKPGDTDTPTGGTRVIQYKIIKDENGNLTFKVLRSYDKQK